jgi:hypothetical protein
MGGRGTAWIVGVVVLASSAGIGCGSSSSGTSGTKPATSAGQAGGGTAGQGDAGHATGGHGAGSGGASTAGAGGMSGYGGSAGTNARGGDGGAATGGVSGGQGGVSGNPGVGGQSAAGSAGENAGDGGTAGGSPSIDCSGTFGEPRVVFDPNTAKLFSPTLNAEETELLYAMGDDNLQYFRSTRSSKLDEFGTGEPLTELDAACVTTDSRTIDLSADGLRVYLVCYGPDNPNTNTLRIALRPAPGAPFVLDPKSYGAVGPSAAIATGDLTLYSSAVMIGQGPALVFERATRSAPFDAGKAIPGLESYALVTPDVSTDGLALFASYMGGIVVATRASASDSFTFGDFIVPSGEYVSPAISEDCRSLYAVRQVPGVLEVFVR